ncbi:MAG: response regulator [Phycisphaerae bacterium]|jgi:response regulator RpfG family c-di-GMP phosphodiesterase
MNPAILIIDDEPHITAAIQRLLRPQEYELFVAHDGPSGLSILAEKDVAVVVCDQRMPGMTGAEVLAQAAQRRPDTYRITLTGYTDVQSLQASVNEGHVQRLLLKPWDDEQLREAVQEGVRQYELLRENRRLLELTQKQAAELAEWNERLTGEVEQRTQELALRNRELLQAQHRVAESLHDVVGVLSSLIEASVPNVALHSKRVTHLARMLGERLELDPDVLRDIEYTARLHEIGGIVRHAPAHGYGRPVPHSQRADTDRRRAEAGCAIVSRVRGFEQVAHAVQCQCEHYDGTGVPQGLRAEDIPLAARIVTIANAYDAAAHADGPAARVSDEAGRRALINGMSRVYDPLLVREFLEGLDALGSANTDDQEVELPPEQVRPGMVLSRDLRNVHGVLVLRRATRLTEEQVGHIRDMSAADPLLSGVFVRCETEAAAEHPSRPAKLPPATPPPPPPRQSAMSARILVVDDDDLVRRALARELRSMGWQVTYARDGREAQDILEDNEFDMLIVDVAMPVMTGPALVAHVQQCWPDQPCLVLTGHATREQLERLTQATNVIGILAKPWDHDRLVKLIREGIAQSKRKAGGDTD